MKTPKISSKPNIKSAGRLKPINPSRGLRSVVNSPMRTPMGSSQANLNLPSVGGPKAKGLGSLGGASFADGGIMSSPTQGTTSSTPGTAGFNNDPVFGNQGQGAVTSSAMPGFSKGSPGMGANQPAAPQQTFAPRMPAQTNMPTVSNQLAQASRGIPSAPSMQTMLAKQPARSMGIASAPKNMMAPGRGMGIATAPGQVKQLNQARPAQTNMPTYNPAPNAGDNGMPVQSQPSNPQLTWPGYMSAGQGRGVANPSFDPRDGGQGNQGDMGFASGGMIASSNRNAPVGSPYLQSELAYIQTHHSQPPVPVMLHRPHAHAPGSQMPSVGHPMSQMPQGQMPLSAQPAMANSKPVKQAKGGLAKKTAAKSAKKPSKGKK
jgi:hypothetical protein